MGSSRDEQSKPWNQHDERQTQRNRNRQENHEQWWNARILQSDEDESRRFFDAGELKDEEDDNQASQRKSRNAQAWFTGKGTVWNSNTTMDWMADENEHTRRGTVCGSNCNLSDCAT